MFPGVPDGISLVTASGTRHSYLEGQSALDATCQILGDRLVEVGENLHR